ncbi:MAG: diaminopimelate epimerase [Steroidobacteraceae bacterium]
MRVEFTKMHGIGNDFIVMDVKSGEPLPPAAVLKRLADRHTGIGFDQALLLAPPRRADTAIYYRIVNADGGEVEQCGNGARCIAELLRRRGVQASGMLAMDSPAGIVRAELIAPGVVSVDMGEPNFAPSALPFLASAEAHVYVVNVNGAEIELGAVSMGNPHAVLTVPDIDTAPVDRLGPAIERHSQFPQRVNVGFMQIVDREHIRLRVFERGTGETRACGTGACAAVAVGQRHARLSESVAVDLPGGRLQVRWRGPGHSIWLEGPAEVVYTGSVEI